ncbi:MAG: S41 family peptidase, partial [Bacteroidota bacterium]
MQKKYLFPLALVLVLIVGVLLGFTVQNQLQDNQNDNDKQLSRRENVRKFEAVLEYVEDHYFEEADVTKMTEDAIRGVMEGLDPHSFYIEPPDMENISAEMQGSFEGIGVQFDIIEDTILVVTPISGGPSDKLGIMAGDRIVEIEGENVAGVGITNKDVIGSLRGEKGTVVNVKIQRPGNKKLIPFAIERDKIPLQSVDYAYMLDDEIGYIKVNRFAETTMREFDEKLSELTQNGMKNLVLDLRNNPGGYLQMAKIMADRFLEAEDMIVYTKGRVPGTNREYRASSSVKYIPEGGIIVLINQGSASASEIVSGAVQDHDRGLIIGRRSFGKGLVQQQKELLDGSAIRVVVSRYYTPSGRCIQKEFDKSSEEYQKEIYDRFQSGEVFDPKKIEFPDSLKYKTVGGRTVYGGGGVMPDIYIVPDTAGNSDYYTDLVTKGVFNQFGFRYAEENGQALKEQYPTGREFAANFKLSNNDIKSFIDFAEEKGVEHNKEEYKTSQARIEEFILALVARSVYGDDGFYPVIHSK